MSTYDLPGFGDEATWPPYTGHPNDPRASDGAGHDDDINARTAELLAGPDYSPVTPANLCEAIVESDIGPLCHLLKAGDMAGAGEALRTVAHGYWEPIARKEAERQIDIEAASACRRCCGRGCRICDEG